MFYQERSLLQPSSLSIFQSPREDHIKFRFVCLVFLDVISRSPLFLSFCFSLLRRIFFCLFASIEADVPEECLELLPNPYFLCSRGVSQHSRGPENSFFPRTSAWRSQNSGLEPSKLLRLALDLALGLESG